MMIGEYPCCEGSLMIALPDVQLPVCADEVCPHCGERVWHFFSRVDPKSYTEEDFLTEYEVNEETKSIKRKATQTTEPMGRE